MLPSLRKQKGKLKPHVRSHVSGRNRLRMNHHPGFTDHLARQAKRLQKVLRRERAANGPL